MLSFLKLKKKHRVVKAHLRKGGGDIIKGIHSIHSAQWQTSCIKRTELPHLLVFQMPLVLINCSFTIVKSLFPSLLSPSSFFWLLHPNPLCWGVWGWGGRKTGWSLFLFIIIRYLVTLGLPDHFYRNLVLLSFSSTGWIFLTHMSQYFHLSGHDEVDCDARLAYSPLVLLGSWLPSHPSHLSKTKKSCQLS